MLTLLEEIKQQGQTMILLQQQILNSRAGSENQLPAALDGRLPATTVEELKLISQEAADGDIQSNLVCIFFCYTWCVTLSFLQINRCVL